MSIAQEQKTLRAAFKNHGEVVRFKEGRPSVFYTPHQLKDGWVNPPTHKSQSGQYATHLQSETPRENQFYKNCEAGCQKKSTEKTLLRVFCEVSWKGNEHLEKNCIEPTVDDFRQDKTDRFQHLSKQYVKCPQHAGLSLEQAEVKDVSLVVTQEEYAIMVRACNVPLTQQSHCVWSGEGQEWEHQAPRLRMKLVSAVLQYYETTDDVLLQERLIWPPFLQFACICETVCPGTRTFVFVLCDVRVCRQVVHVRSCSCALSLCALMCALAIFTSLFKVGMRPASSTILTITHISGRGMSLQGGILCLCRLRDLSRPEVVLWG